MATVTPNGRVMRAQQLAEHMDAEHCRRSADATAAVFEVLLDLQDAMTGEELYVFHLMVKASGCRTWPRLCDEALEAHARLKRAS